MVWQKLGGRSKKEMQGKKQEHLDALLALAKLLYPVKVWL
jgi:hypothetical protein